MEQAPTLVQWLLAFAGALLVILNKVHEMSQAPGYRLGDYLKKYWVSIIATAVMIPTLLVVISDSSLKEILPINNVTALLCGYQTQDIFKKVISLGQTYTK